MTTLTADPVRRTTHRPRYQLNELRWHPDKKVRAGASLANPHQVDRFAHPSSCQRQGPSELGSAARLARNRTCVRKLRHAVLGVCSRSLSGRPRPGAGSVFGGVGGLRVPGSGRRELRASHVLLPLLRADGANPALLGRATAGGSVVIPSQVRLTAIRSRTTRVSVVIRKLGFVLLSILPRFCSQNTPCGPASPPMPGHIHAERESSSRRRRRRPHPERVVNWKYDTSPSTRGRGDLPHHPGIQLLRVTSTASA
jgi:hypothetical protein